MAMEGLPASSFDRRTLSPVLIVAAWPRLQDQDPIRQGCSERATATTVGRPAVDPPKREIRRSRLPPALGCWIETSARSCAVSRRNPSWSPAVDGRRPGRPFRRIVAQHQARVRALVIHSDDDGAMHVVGPCREVAVAARLPALRGRVEILRAELGGGVRQRLPLGSRRLPLVVFRHSDLACGAALQRREMQPAVSLAAACAMLPAASCNLVRRDLPAVGGRG